MADGRIYMLQPSFASGEISPDVASRVDLDKYQSALLQAENVFVRPYGSAYRRPGTKRISTLATSNIRLQEFSVDAANSYLLEFGTNSQGNGFVSIWKDDVYQVQIPTPFADVDLHTLRFAQSADVMFIASGKHPVQVLTRYNDTTWTMTDFAPAPGYFDSTTMTNNVTILPNKRSGNDVVLTASGNVFSADQEGNTIVLRQNIGSQTTSLTQADASPGNEIIAGPPGWKVVSHGTWTGHFTIEYYVNGTWQTLRRYSSANDNNVTESGTFDKETPIRLNATIASGTFTANLTRLPFVAEGWATINAGGYTDAKHVTVTTGKAFGNSNTPAADWAFGSWSEKYGYPSCVVFFQDRLCFAANKRQPYMVWMSRTGDYYNFGTEKVDGTLTDDSAVALSFISRRDFRILHLMAEADLLVMTEGNEWIVSGSSTVTPTSVTPKVQTSRGTTDVEPVMIGGQMIYIQRHGKTVRDLQYNFTTDSYDGMDLNILAKHITQDTTIIDAAYRQEPDYMMFFVLDDGTCACLTYINEQKVYAWSRMVTKGKYIAVESITAENQEDVYFVVQRENGNGQTVNYLEKLADYPHGDSPDEYVMLDCAGVSDSGDSLPSKTITRAWLANRTDVDVLADGRHIRNLTADASGTVTLPVACTTSFVIGIPYTSIWELPNIEIQLQDGTLQGRRKKVSEVILRLERSLGGRVGINTDKTDVIKYEEILDQDAVLYTGEKLVTMPNVTAGGFNDKGRVAITSDEPYPLSISSIVRAVVSGG